jgi:uncharacterized protein YcgI (DUF1989 family)
MVAWLATGMELMSAAERIVVPAREGRAVRVERGRWFRVVDVEGPQVGDVFAFAADDLAEFHSASHTRTHVERLFPAVGEQFVSNRRRPMLMLIEDSSPGMHDMLIAACDPDRYAGLGVSGWHASCAENLQRVLAEAGASLGFVPQPINVFMRIALDGDGALRWLPAASRSGDSVTFEALMDCIVVVCACPQDVVDINNGGPRALAVDVLATPTR